jgi:hypothetical protein
MRDRPTEHDIIGTRPRPATRVDDLPMFAPAARTSDPQTSHTAAASVDRATIVRRLLEAYAAHPAGLTTSEVAALTGLDEYAASKRASDAESTGLVYATGATRRGSSGRLQQVRVITPEGREWLALPQR